jgi:hypothetical protein
MSGVLTTASSVTCGHAPGAVQTSSNAKLTVGGNPVLLKSSIDRQPVSGCVTPPATDASGPTAGPCTFVTGDPYVPAPPPAAGSPGVTAGEAQKLTANGNPVMLDTLAGKTNGMVAKTTPQTLLAATAGQSKLTAI